MLATAEEMKPLYQYLQSFEGRNNDAISTGKDVDAVFDKGVICADGRLDLCKQV